MRGPVPHKISQICGIQLTNDLGKYLGVPLFHARDTKEKFQYVIDNVRAKLSGWKVSQLSFAGQKTLIQSVSQTIPTHLMQTVKLPDSIILFVGWYRGPKEDSLSGLERYLLP